jgi:hypothetical protein
MKTFSFVVVHSGSKPLGDAVPEDHAAFTTLSHWISGPSLQDLQVGEGGHVRRASTADGHYLDNRRVRHIEYSVTRIS